ncbi:MAG TPA: glycosyltransferase family 4 protein [Desulfobacteraceae bacterium]|nr:glycosyltransferase family 4 protein [Desulfobacteraceae bacterium]HPJ68632.1 glycosyltransferase family 4 protein [Desulfobacteraceae bacterium]HPQ27539.1 glycosyltransferase family 4 protein [Desulfobacteraceae bacterium]
MKRVIVLNAQVPFVKGGAELHCESLVSAINSLEGIRAQLVQLPFKWYPEEQMLNDIMAWRLIDLSESNGTKIDLVIATKFPTYAVQHSNKALWLIHQHRTLYDLENTEYDSWRFEKDAKVIRDKIRSLDNKFLAECKCLYTNGRNTASRLKKYNGFDGEALFPPPVLADQIKPGAYGQRVIYIGRLEPNKRPDLLISAASLVPKAKISIIGKGKKEEKERLKMLIKKAGLSERCELLGFLPEEELLRYLSNARAVFYAPYDEDYGYATIEAFLALKPVITCFDSGEVKTFVEESGSGFVSDTDPDSIANNLRKVYDMTEVELAEMASRGHELARGITWDKVLRKLVLANL